MILQSLHALYGRLRGEPSYLVPAPGYSLQKITFKVVITPRGELFAIQDARRPAEGGPRPRQELVPGDSKPSGQGINPCFLWDNTGYLLGYKSDDSKPERTRATFESFRDKHLRLEAEIDSPAFSAVCRFLAAWDPAEACEHPVLAETATGFGVFQLQAQAAFVHQDPAVAEWWRGQVHGDSAAGSGQCLITGARAPLARTHPKIRGVAGGKAQATIAGFNEPAYESYGKRQSYNAPVSEAAAFRYVTGLNALLDGPMSGKHRLRIGDTTAVFWTGRPTPTEDIFARFAAEGSAALDEEAQDEGTRLKLAAFLRALRHGQEEYGELEEDPEGTPFYLLGLAPNAARISIRFFHHDTLAALLENLRRHYRHMSMARQPAVGKRRADPEFPPLWMLLRQTGREARDIPPILAGPLLRAVITGTRYPDGLYTAVLRRLHADRNVNYLRACVIKACLIRNRNQEVSMSLDTERANPAYRLGRLFATLEKTQKDALGKVGASIRDRFYSSASATPRSVFPRLLRTYQHHLAKLGGGRGVNREKLVQEIVDPLSDFPAHLDLAEQGLFAIGYYHQTRDFYISKASSGGTERDPEPTS